MFPRCLLRGFLLLVSVLLVQGLQAKQLPREELIGHNGGGEAATSDWAAVGYEYPFQDPSLPISQRTSDLLSRLTLPEKVSQLFYTTESIQGEPVNEVPRLGLANFNLMGQTAIRGACNGCNLNCFSPLIDGVATVFATAIAQASTFNQQLVFNLGVVTADESAAIQRHYPNRSVEYRTTASSVINIARDGRWGRVPETYGEDPILTTQMGIALNKALLGYDNLSDKQMNKKWAKVLPTLRHFIDYDGPDNGRFRFNGVISDTDLELTFFPAWKALIQTLSTGDDSMMPSMLGVMSAIGATNGSPDVLSKRLLQDVLRYEWQFNGFVISDCDPMGAVQSEFHYTASDEQSSALSVTNGNDVNCGVEFATLQNATHHGLVTQAVIDRATTQLLRARVVTGDLDPVDLDPYANIPYSVVDSQPHRDLASQTVRESVVLLKNNPPILPFDLTNSKIKTIAVIGPSVNDSSVYAHTYHGTPSRWWAPIDGIIRIAQQAGVKVVYARGADRHSDDESDFLHAVDVCASADIIIYIGGLDCTQEEEDTDRDDFRLAGAQLALIQLIAATSPKTPFAVMLISGGPVSEPWIVDNIPALLWVGYQGQAADAVADVLFGLYAPSGRLPYTIPRDTSQVPDITNYLMTAAPGRTYRYLNYTAAPPLFPFGYGLTYSQIQFNDLSVIGGKLIYQQPFSVTVKVSNLGKWDTDVPVLLFASFINSTVQNIPLRQLLQFTKVSILSGGVVVVSFTVSLHDQAAFGAARQTYPSSLRLWIGDAQNEYIGLAMPIALE